MLLYQSPNQRSSDVEKHPENSIKARPWLMGQVACVSILVVVQKDLSSLSLNAVSPDDQRDSSGTSHC
jgi:hypothetical protein